MNQEQTSPFYIGKDASDAFCNSHGSMDVFFDQDWGVKVDGEIKKLQDDCDLRVCRTCLSMMGVYFDNSEEKIIEGCIFQFWDEVEPMFENPSDQPVVVIN